MVTEAEKDDPAWSPRGSVPRLVVPIAPSGVDVSCCSSTTMSDTMGRTSKFPLLETIHCYVQVQEDIDPVRNKDPIMYRDQALSCVELPRAIGVASIDWVCWLTFSSRLASSLKKLGLEDRVSLLGMFG